MNEAEKIIKLLTELNETVREQLGNVNARLDTYEQILSDQAKRVRRQQSTIRRHEEDISRLKERVDALAETSAIWRSRDRREAGIDVDEAYAAFGELGYSNRDAFRALDAAGKIRRSAPHFTRVVRVGDRSVRAVIIVKG